VHHGGWPIFYKIGREHLHVYLELGLGVTKLGEEARVRLTDFSLDGPQRRNLRRVWRKTVEEGCSFEVLAPSAVAALVDELRAVSDAWLRAKRSREKGFSLGAYDDDYVKRYPVGVARKEGKIVAFANVWCSGQQEELEVDLMRFSEAAPPGVMRYLFVEFMLWGRQQGYRWFNLAMAPLSGLRRSPIAPLWTQLGSAVYGLGERWYNFQGIRSFKEWFYPTWEPKYLVSPGGTARPIVLANIATLISGGVEGVVAK
jgi:phosphatidylglycerol lysyltransferase